MTRHQTYLKRKTYVGQVNGLDLWVDKAYLVTEGAL